MSLSGPPAAPGVSLKRPQHPAQFSAGKQDTEASLLIELQPHPERLRGELVLMERTPAGSLLVTVLWIGVLPLLQQPVEPRLLLRLELAGRIGDEGLLNWTLRQAARPHQPDIEVGGDPIATIRRHLGAELEQAAKERSEAEATERGEYRELWESRGKPAEEQASALAAKVEAFEAARKARQDSRREALGTFADGIPEGVTGDQLDKMLGWAESLKTKASTASSAPLIPTGSGSQDGAKPATKVSEKESEWMRRTKPSWLNAPEDSQRSLLDRFGPSWARRSD